MYGSSKTCAAACFAALLLLALVLLQLPLPGAAVEVACASPAPGWEDQTPLPGGEDLMAVDAVNGNVAWAVGAGGTILKTSDGGVDWDEQDSGLGSPTVVLTCISAVDDLTAWAGGIDGADGSAVLLKTTDGGANWVPQEEALDDFKSSGNLSLAVSGVCALDTGVVWVSINYVSTGLAPLGLFYDARVWRSDDGGASWAMKLNTTVPPRVNAIYAVDDQVAWAAGGSDFEAPYPAVFVTTDGGASWSYRYLDFFSGPKYKVVDVWAADALTAWALYAPVGSSEGGAKKTSDGGMTWQTQPAEAGIVPNALSAVDAGTLWAVGSSGRIYATIDGGATWIIQDSGVAADLNGVSAADAETAWAVGDEGVILKTSDGGGGAPYIYSLAPSSGVIGTEVAVNGYNFGDTRDSSYVSFGGVQATGYVSWSDTEIVVEVPAGAPPEAAVAVTTAEGTSNAVAFSAYAPLALASITPDQAAQNSITVEISDLSGTGFQPGAKVRFELDGLVLEAYDVNVLSAESITCKIGFFFQPVGDYDVVVENPDGAVVRLEGGFTVTSACGEGGGMALLMLGLTLGLLSLAGSARLKKTGER